MGKGPKMGQQRAKTGKHLRQGSEKKFSNDDQAAKVKYAAKMNARANRRLKKHK